MNENVHVVDASDPEARKLNAVPPVRWHRYLRPWARFKFWLWALITPPPRERARLELQRYLVEKISQDYRPSLESLRRDGWSFAVTNIESEWRKHPKEWKYELRLRWWPTYDTSGLIVVRAECPGWVLSHPDALEKKLIGLEGPMLAEIDKRATK